MLERLRIENLVLIREAEVVFGPTLNAFTGETGAGKTIFAHALGLLLGQKGDSSVVGAAGDEAYVEAEFAVPDGFFEGAEPDDAVVELRPANEEGDRLVVARRVFADGRTRAYAWGRAVAREDLAATVERLLSMSGQFEQRRLARPSYQLEVLDRAAGAEQLVRRREARSAWRELTAARRRYEEIRRDEAGAAARTAELRQLVEHAAGLVAADELALREERERSRHVADLGLALQHALAALDPDEGDGALALLGQAERELGPVAAITRDLAAGADELRELSERGREIARSLRNVLDGLDASPERLEEIEGCLQLWSDLRRRYGCQTAQELVDRRSAGEAELASIETSGDPLQAALEDVAASEARMEGLAQALAAARAEVAPRFAASVAAELAEIGMGEGEFTVELRARELGPTGRDEAVFLIRPNAGLPLGPVAETASGGELSRVALAIAAVAGGDTLVFDEIDAGIGGITANKVASLLGRLADRAQVVTITHLPQIASVADDHFRVEKVPGDPTHTRIERLQAGERKGEFERMLGGEAFLATISGAGAQDPEGS